MGSFSSTAGGAASGALAGSQYGPEGAAIGGVLGAGAGLLGGGGSSSSGLGYPFGYSYQTPAGSLSSNGLDTVYSPNVNPVQQETSNTIYNKLFDTVNSLPNQFDVNAAYNNPFYQSSLSLLQQPILQQQQTAQTNLNNQLNAQNQVGGSFDALQNNLLSQQYNTLLQNAQNQARNMSLQAYNQNFNNNLSQLSALGQAQNSANQNEYFPAALGASFMQPQ